LIKKQGNNSFAALAVDTDIPKRVECLPGNFRRLTNLVVFQHLSVFAFNLVFCRMQSIVNRKFSCLFCFVTYICLSTLSTSCGSSLHTVQAVGGTDSLSFIVMGDWGKDGTGHQKTVADQMDIMSRQYNAQFIITTGDNFYDRGVESTSDLRWKTSFENIYNKKGHWIKWYPTLGNHDYGLNPQAQVEYSGVSTRWNMPARHYKLQKKVDGKHKALFVFTDTSPFVSSYHERTMADLKRQDTAAQLKWLKKTLTGDKHRWKIVVGHHPLYSSGAHGNTPELIERFKPVFLHTKTDIYLCGHDHTLEHYAQPEESTHYLVSGGGGAGLYKIRSNPFSRFAKSSAGFLVVTLYADKANFYFYNETGELLYREQITK
jgi:hypothetical protein